VIRFRLLEFQADLLVLACILFGCVTACANVFLLVYAALSPILNPIGTAPVVSRPYILLHVERNALARRVAIISVLLLAGSMFIGWRLRKTDRSRRGSSTTRRFQSNPLLRIASR